MIIFREATLTCQEEQIKFMKSMMPGDGIEGMTLNLMAGALTIKLLRQLQYLIQT